MADRRPNRNSHSSSHSRRHHSDSRVARRSSNSPRANPYPSSIIYEDPYETARYQATARMWSWLPESLENWRTEEGMHYPAPAGGHPSMDLSPFTREPTHLTVPVLAARLHRHERQLIEMDTAIEDVRSTWVNMASGRLGEIHTNQLDITETMETVHNQVIGNTNVISTLQARLVQCETRTREAEEYSRSLEQRLATAEETLRMVGRLTTALERVNTLFPPQNQPPNPRQD